MEEMKKELQKLCKMIREKNRTQNRISKGNYDKEAN